MIPSRRPTKAHGTSGPAPALPLRKRTPEEAMHGIVYMVGLVVIVLAVLSFVGIG